MAYDVRFSEAARAHLKILTARERSTILNRAATILTNEPKRLSRNLKELRANPISRYELRAGQLRLFFEMMMKTRWSSS